MKKILIFLSEQLDHSLSLTYLHEGGGITVMLGADFILFGLIFSSLLN